MKKPLRTIRVIEFEGKGPGPLAAQLLADFGAEFTVIVRPESSPLARMLGGAIENPTHRGKRLLALDLKTPGGLSAALELIAHADALIEGNRPA